MKNVYRKLLKTINIIVFKNTIIRNVEILKNIVQMVDHKNAVRASVVKEHKMIFSTSWAS